MHSRIQEAENEKETNDISNRNRGERDIHRYRNRDIRTNTQTDRYTDIHDNR